MLNYINLNYISENQKVENPHILKQHSTAYRMFDSNAKRWFILLYFILFYFYFV